MADIRRLRVETPAAPTGEEAGQDIVDRTGRKAGRHGGGEVFEDRQARERLRIEDEHIDPEADGESEGSGAEAAAKPAPASRRGLKPRSRPRRTNNTDDEELEAVG